MFLPTFYTTSIKMFLESGLYLSLSWLLDGECTEENSLKRVERKSGTWSCRHCIKIVKLSNKASLSVPASKKKTKTKLKLYNQK